MSPVDQIDSLVDVAVLGKQVEIFRDSRVGKFVSERINHEIEAAVQELKIVDPTFATRVQSIQNRIKVAESIGGWLDQAIMAGLEATKILEDREE